ncbi:Tricarboxylate transport protein TctC [Orrella dioscoreae]|uniref:Tricarboxylate transport protein TctC n=2 Tax=root TaxID=1 RepID=A0A1C3K0Q3_9BURK|nr:Tricarboxylate transport protein TctC [Orrella dioscoreae]SOE50832.1 Tricarboxylate transport protein TctC [Orrella dioscoreae]
MAAQTFPAKPIQLVIPFQPGDTDNMLRPFVDRMQEFLGQPVVLNYKPGAGGGIGAGSVAASPPDGYTLVGSSPGSLVVVPLANKEVKYRFDDFAPVAALAEGGLMLVVPASSPWKTARDLVEASRRKPGDVTFTSSGALGITHLLAEAFAREAGVKWTHIPFQGSGPAITALLGGHVQMASTAIAPAQAHLQAGTLRALAVFGDQRLKAYPDVPTLRELGYRIGSPTLYGIAAPKGTPPEVVDRLYQAARQASEKYAGKIGETLTTFGAQAHVLGPREYAEYLKGQHALFAEAVKGLE